MIGPMDAGEEFDREYYEWTKENERGFYEWLSEKGKKEITEDEFVVFRMMPFYEDRLIKDGFKIDYDKWINWLADFCLYDEEYFRDRVIRRVRPEIRKMLKQNERLVKKFPVLNKY